MSLIWWGFNSVISVSKINHWFTIHVQLCWDYYSSLRIVTSPNIRVTINALKRNCPFWRNVLSLAVPKVVRMKTSGAVSGEDFVKVTFSSQYFHEILVFYRMTRSYPELHAQCWFCACCICYVCKTRRSCVPYVWLRFMLCKIPFSQPRVIVYIWNLVKENIIVITWVVFISSQIFMNQVQWWREIPNDKVSKRGHHWFK